MDSGAVESVSDMDSGMAGLGPNVSNQITMLKAHQKNLQVQQMLDAAYHGNVQKLTVLLSRSASLSINDVDSNGRTALHVASSEGRLDVVKLLLEAGADFNCVDSYENTALNDAVRHKHDEVAACIRDQVNSKKTRGGALVLPGCQAAVRLISAAFDGDFEEVVRLIMNGVSVNSADYDGRCALHLAACEGHVGIVSHLLSAKADLEARDRFGGTALHDAIRHKHPDVCKLLKDAGCQLIGMDIAILLCESSSTGDIESLKALLENGVNPNLADYDGRTALHLASSNGRTTALDYLLSQPNLDVNPVDVTGGTPLDDAIRHNQRVSQEMLRNAGGLMKDDPMLEQSKALRDRRKQKQDYDIRQPDVHKMLSASKEMNGRDQFSKMIQLFSEVCEVQKSKKDSQSESADSPEHLEMGEIIESEQQDGAEEASAQTFVHSLNRCQHLSVKILASFEASAQTLKSAGEDPFEFERNDSDLQEVVSETIRKKLEKVSVQVVSGTNLPKTDLRGFCDGYVNVCYASEECTTKICRNTLNPVWEDTMDFKADAYGPRGDMVLHLWDWNRMGDDELIGAAVVKKYVIESALVRGEADGGSWHELSVPILRENDAANEGSCPTIRLKLRGQYVDEKSYDLHEAPLSAGSLGLRRELETVWPLTQQLLRELASIYHSVPELPSSAPKLFHMLGTEYQQTRSTLHLAILRNALLSQHVLQCFERFSHKTDQSASLDGPMSPMRG